MVEKSLTHLGLDPQPPPRGRRQGREHRAAAQRACPRDDLHPRRLRPVPVRPRRCQGP